MLPYQGKRIEGMFIIVDRGNAKGLNHWANELERRRIPALIQIDEYTLQNHLDIIKDLSKKGFETGCVWNERPFWNEPYAFQHETIKHMKDRVESSIGKPMRAFSSKFFAYDEVTLQVADALGVDYILARGTAGAKGIVYKPEEYKTRIVSVSAVPFKEMGVGSLADESLRWRGVTPDEFREILFALKEEKIILVAQSHLSGVKLHWWNAYQEFLNADIVAWKSLDAFSAHPIVLPTVRIPFNTEIKYLKSEPKIPMEQEIDFSFEET